MLPQGLGNHVVDIHVEFSVCQDNLANHVHSFILKVCSNCCCWKK